MTKKLCLLLLSSFFLFVGCKSSQKAAPGDSFQSKSAASQRSLLWELSSDQTDTKSYLFGTMHMMPKEDYVMPDTIKHLLSSCKKLILEIDYSAMNNIGPSLLAISKEASLTNGKTVKDYLSEEDYNILSARMKKLGIPMFIADRMKPFFLSLMMDMDGNQLSEMASFEMELGKIAQKEGLETGGLESIEDQMKLFNAISVEDQADMLSKSLHSDPSDSNQSQLDSLIAIYKSQDIDRIEDFVIEADKTMAMNKALFLDNRNENWIPLIQDEMGQGAAFIAVGAGHLGGEKGVVKLLKKAGINVTPIIFKFHDSKDRQK